jgi:hypothetical protein
MATNGRKKVVVIRAGYGIGIARIFVRQLPKKEAQFNAIVLSW